MKYFAILLVLASAVTIGSAGYRSNYLYALTLSCSNASFEFQGITTIVITVVGQNYSYTNLTTYGAPNNYTKLVELDYSLERVQNISIFWQYTYDDLPEFLIYRPLIQCRTFSIIPIYDTNYNSNLVYDKRGLRPDFMQYNDVYNNPSSAPYNANTRPTVPQPNLPANYNPATTNQYTNSNNRPYPAGTSSTYREKPIFLCLDRYSIAARQGIPAYISTQFLRCGAYQNTNSNSYNSY